MTQDIVHKEKVFPQNEFFYDSSNYWIEKIILESGLKAKIFITGGLGKVIQPLLNLKSQYEENLTLDGLEEIYKLNN